MSILKAHKFTYACCPQPEVSCTTRTLNGKFRGGVKTIDVQFLSSLLLKHFRLLKFSRLSLPFENFASMLLQQHTELYVQLCIMHAYTCMPAHVLARCICAMVEHLEHKDYFFQSALSNTHHVPEQQ
jgi:hypothetical protein